MAESLDRMLLMRDVVDYPLITRDGRIIGRVADVELLCQEDGSVTVSALVTGPEALAARISSRLGSLLHLLLDSAFERRIAVGEIEDVHLEVHLRGRAEDYHTGQSDRWIADHILRFIPGARR